MHKSLPPLALILGTAGIIPFAVFGIAAVGASSESALTATRGLVGYGAVILAFLGGVHWGFTLDEPELARYVRVRLTLGVVPALIGWAAILVSLVSEPALGLAILIAGFVATVVIEWRGHKLGLVSGGYMLMRWGISIVVIALLTAVLVVRVIGGHVLM